jgi:hypothetical protein
VEISVVGNRKGNYTDNLKKKSRKHCVFRTIQRRDRDSNPGNVYTLTD